MDEPAHVPQLGDDPAARFMDRGRNRLPSIDLGVVPQARRVGPAETLAADSGRFTDDQAGGGTLAAIERGDIQRQIQDSAYRAQQRTDSGETIVVGVNLLVTDPSSHIDLLTIDP